MNTKKYQSIDMYKQKNNLNIIHPIPLTYLHGNQVE